MHIEFSKFLQEIEIFVVNTQLALSKQVFFLDFNVNLSYMIRHLFRNLSVNEIYMGADIKIRYGV